MQSNDTDFPLAQQKEIEHFWGCQSWWCTAFCCPINMTKRGEAMRAEKTIDWEEEDKAEEEPESLVTSTPERDAVLQEWCLLPEVSLPFAHLDAPMGASTLSPSRRWRSSEITYNSGTWPRVTCARVVWPLKVLGKFIGELGMSTRQHKSAHWHRRAAIDKTRWWIYLLSSWRFEVFCSWLMSDLHSRTSAEVVINLISWLPTLGLFALKVFLWLMFLELTDYIMIEIDNSLLHSLKISCASTRHLLYTDYRMQASGESRR